MNKNGFILLDALFGLFIILLCSALLLIVLSIGRDHFGYYVDEEIETQWFYFD